ncbi:branched-chain amino acid ABC transporter substrate-binding protein [Mesorhizobium sp. KR2-14]|uniref:branched-chain amino acid ABC transporter substrate-binding protein n=1 Tax=Mesorhizobium sp. KR2-14 TaxID=3156610 RepID=UPI0032B3938A
MRIAGFVIGALGGLLLAGFAHAEALRIGVAAPLSGPSSVLGVQIRDGAEEAAADRGTVKLHIADDGCTAEGGAKAAKQFSEAKVQAVVGFLCGEAIEAALPILKEANIPVITVGVRTDSLTDRRDKSGWPVFRLAPRADGEREAAGRLLTKLWRNELFAVIDDGTIYGRELAESFRAAAEREGLKPVFIDTFRQQLDNQIGLVGRLRKAEASRVFAGGDREDIAIMARDAQKIGAEIVFAGGETLRAAAGPVPLAPGTLMIGLPEWQEVADKAVVAKFTDRGVVPEGYVLPAYSAVQVALAALEEAGSNGDLMKALTEHDFRTSIGPIRFDSKGDLSQNPYRVFRYDGKRFVQVEMQ